jgi:ribose-phosphate pyrophosphokinase
MLLISGSSNELLAKAIGGYANENLAARKLERFRDGEIMVDILENVRGQDCFVIQSTSNPADSHLMELLVIMDALRRGSARRITAVIPYYGYARQDRKTGARSPITAKLVANLIETAGANRVLTLDLHAAQIQGFFEVPTDNLFSRPVLMNAIKNRFVGELSNCVIVSPDVGGVARARQYAAHLGVDLAIIDKRRSKPGESEVMNIIGEVKSKHCILIDDIADSAGTLCHAAAALLAKDGKSVSAFVTHGVLSEGACAAVERSSLDRLVITNSIGQSEEASRSKKIEQVCVSRLLGEAIIRVEAGRSVSSLFHYDEFFSA